MSDEPEKTPDDTHQLLAQMLGRQRSEAQRAEVDAVLSSGLSAAEQVAAIRAIDAGGARAAASSRAGRSHDAPRRSTPNVDSATVASAIIGDVELAPSARERRRDIVRRRVVLRNSIRAVTFWDYLLRHRARIQQFNKRTGLLTLKLFALRLRLNREMLPSVARLFENDLQQTCDVLAQVLTDGWRVATKAEYNLLRLAHGICESAIALGVPPDLPGDAFPIKRYAAVERDLLVLAHCDPDGARCAAAVERYFRWRSDLKHVDLIRARGLLATLPDFTAAPLSLGSYMLALNIVSYGRYVELTDLKGSVDAELIESEQFDCPESTLEEIATFIADMIAQIPPRAAQLQNLAPIDLYLVHDEEGKLDLASLRQWCNLPAEDRNVVALASGVAEAVRGPIAALLDGHVEMVGGFHAVVFESGCFSEQISRVTRIGESLARLSYSLPTFTRTRYRDVRDGGGSSTSMEREAAGLIDDLVRHVVTIGRQCTKFLAHRCTTPGCADPATLPFSPVVFQRPFIAIETDQIVAGPAPFDTLSLLDAIGRVAQIAFMVGDYFEDATITSDRSLERRLRTELASIFATLKRIAHAEVYDRICERWPTLTQELGARGEERA